MGKRIERGCFIITTLLKLVDKVPSVSLVLRVLGINVFFANGSIFRAYFVLGCEDRQVKVSVFKSLLQLLNCFSGVTMVVPTQLSRQITSVRHKLVFYSIPFRSI